MTLRPDDPGPTPRVSFIGAGPGDVELMTLRGRALIEQADVLIYADSLVDDAICAWAQPHADIYRSSAMTLEETTAVMVQAARAGRRVVRVQSGDPSLYGAIHEQMAALDRAGIPYTIVPGVSSAFAAAASLGVELTVPEVSQTVIFTRLPGRTSVPSGERLRDLAAHGATLAIFLSITRIRKVCDELRAGGYAAETPVAVVHRASWPDELVLRGSLADIADRVKQAGLKAQALILVGRALDRDLRRRTQESDVALRSNLYDPGYTHTYRRGSDRQRRPDPADPEQDMAPPDVVPADPGAGHEH
jgi:precorrin-4/cobalt-precorrin-4 C11-methyltransferase